jgi:hypothetical protein
MPADFRGVPRGPGAFDQGTTGMAVARRGDAARSAPLSRRVCCGCEAQGVHELSGMLAPGEVAECGHGGHRARAWHPTQGLERVDDGGEPPGLPLVCALLFQTRQPVGVVGDRAEVFLQDDLLRRGGTDDLAAPSEVGRAPGGPACVTDSVPQETGFQPPLRGLQITDGLFTRPAQVPHGFIRNRWDRDRGEVPRAHQAGQCEGVPTVGCDPLPGLCGEQRRGNAPADVAFFGARALEPIATRPRFRDKDEVGAVGL